MIIAHVYVNSLFLFTSEKYFIVVLRNFPFCYLHALDLLWTHDYYIQSYYGHNSLSLCEHNFVLTLSAKNGIVENTLNACLVLKWRIRNLSCLDVYFYIPINSENCIHKQNISLHKHAGPNYHNHFSSCYNSLSIYSRCSIKQSK